MKKFLFLLLFLPLLAFGQTNNTIDLLSVPNGVLFYQGGEWRQFSKNEIVITYSNSDTEITIRDGRSTLYSGPVASLTISGQTTNSGKITYLKTNAYPVSSGGGGGGGGDASAANQVTGNTSLAGIDTKLTSTNSNLSVINTEVTNIDNKLNTLGQKNSSGSAPVVIASDQSTVPVLLSSVPLPTGAATSALQTTGNSSLSSIDTKTPALGVAAPSGSTPVTLPNDVTVSGPTAQSVVNTDLLTGTVNGWYDAANFHSGSVQIIASAGISAGAIIFEQTNDVTNAAAGVTMPVQEPATVSNSSLIGAQTIAASTIRAFVFPINARYIRVRISTAFTGGTVQAVGVLSQLPLSLTQVQALNPTAANLNVTASIAATQTLSTVTTVGTVTTLTGGGTAEDAATTSSPHIVGGIARTTLPASTVIAGDAVRATFSTSGQLVNKPFAPGDLDFQAFTTITTATQTAIRAAQATGIRQYVTSITYQNTNATATTVTIQDGNTTLTQFSAPASMANPVQLQFLTPLRGTAATALNYTAGTTGANVLLTVTGFNAY